MPSSAIVGWVEHGAICTGFWCPTCLLPSAVQTEIYLLGSEGICGSFGKITLCPECGYQDYPKQQRP